MERGVQDRGGLPTDELIDRAEHTLEEWEVLTDALAGALARRGLMNVDELRRGIESMPRDEYEQAAYYERLAVLDGDDPHREGRARCR